LLSFSPEFIDALASAVVAKLPPPAPAPPTPLVPLLVDIEQLAPLLGVSVSTIERLKREGKIPSITMNSRRLYCPSSVIQALEEK